MKKILFLILLITLVFYVSSYFNNSNNSCDELNSIEMSISIVSDNLNFIGINTDNDSLKFGKVSPLATVERKVVVENSEEVDVRVFLSGELSSWVTVDPFKFKIKPNEVKEVSFKVEVPADAGAGNYSGEALFCFKK
ncbi:MAG: hypothetical protein ABIH82_05565 [Candidatus Woesearchaeota archaeon]